MARYKVGKGKSWEKYCMSVLQAMYDGEIDRFTEAEFASYAGLTISTSTHDFLTSLVKRGWLSVVPAELHPNESRRRTVYSLASAVWFGVKSDV